MADLAPILRQKGTDALRQQNQGQGQGQDQQEFQFQYQTSASAEAGQLYGSPSALHVPASVRGKEFIPLFCVLYLFATHNIFTHCGNKVCARS